MLPLGSLACYRWGIWGVIDSYGTGGAREIRLEDLAGLDVTPDDLYACVIMASQLTNFLDNKVATQSDYRTTASKIRTGI